MAATVEARRLTEAHRLAQARLGARVVRQMLAAWGLLDPEDIDGSFDRWLRIVLPVVQANRATSSTLAANYLATFRALELGVEAPAVPVLAPAAQPEAVATSMLVTGPVSIRAALGRGVQFQRAVATAQTTTARAAMRHALAGGRDTIAATVAADQRALGWARAASGRPCAFCAMLASRGPVYSEDTVGFQAHDGCSCAAEPVYRRDADWPAGGRRYQELWRQAKAAHGDTTKAFRRLLEAA